MQRWACWCAGVTGVGLLHRGGRYYNVNGWKSAWMCVRRLVASRCAVVQRVEVQLMEGCCVHGCRFVWAADTQGCGSAGIQRITGCVQVCSNAGVQGCMASKAAGRSSCGGAVLEWCCVQGCRLVGAQRNMVAGIPGAGRCQGRGTRSQGPGCVCGECEVLGVAVLGGRPAGWLACWMLDWLEDSDAGLPAARVQIAGDCQQTGVQQGCRNAGIQGRRGGVCWANWVAWAGWLAGLGKLGLLVTWLGGLQAIVWPAGINPIHMYGM